MSRLKNVFAILDSPVDGKIETMSVYTRFTSYEEGQIEDVDDQTLAQAKAIVQAVNGAKKVVVEWTEDGDEWDYEHRLDLTEDGSVEHTCSWESEWGTPNSYSEIVLIPGLLPCIDTDLESQVNIFCELAGIDN